MNEPIRVCAECGYIIVDFNSRSSNNPPKGYTNITHGLCNSCLIVELIDNGSTKEQALAFVANMEKEENTNG